jgi:hypothetical protein
MTAESDSAVLQVVFIDSDVPDLQDLLNGLQPGAEAFVLNPGSDGLGQIAAILAANHLSNLASISIVGHGSDGEMQLGSTMLSEANLASNAAALAAIGAALQPGGDIQLYGCNVAQGTPGQQFIDDFSALAGGATVAAATHLVGAADEGGSWALNVAVGTGTDTAGDPFTAAMEAAYPDVLAAVTGKIIFLSTNDETGPDDVGTRVQNPLRSLQDSIRPLKAWRE